MVAKLLRSFLTRRHEENRKITKQSTIFRHKTTAIPNQQ